MTKYAFAHGSPFVGDPDEIQAELELLRGTGGLTPGAVVVAARPRRSVLHPIIFHVDEKEASERYYHDRARRLIKSIVILRDDEPTLVRANVLVASVATGDKEYVSIDSDGAREIEMARLKRDMARLSSQLRELRLYPQLVIALEEALAA